MTGNHAPDPPSSTPLSPALSPDRGGTRGEGDSEELSLNYLYYLLDGRGVWASEEEDKRKKKKKRKTLFYGICASKVPKLLPWSTGECWSTVVLTGNLLAMSPVEASKLFHHCGTQTIAPVSSCSAFLNICAHGENSTDAKWWIWSRCVFPFSRSFKMKV